MTTPPPNLPPPPPDDGYEIEIARPFHAMNEAYTDTDTGNVIVPDYIGEIIAWRVWQVWNPTDPTSIRLQSLGTIGSQNSTVWTPGKRMEAFCGKAHSVPAEPCSCGFYSAKDKEHLLSMSYHRGDNFTSADSPLVIGEVALCGKLIPGTQGWRSQYARPVRVLVPYSRWKLLKPLQAMYPGVTFTLENFLTEPKGVNE